MGVFLSQMIRKEDLRGSKIPSGDILAVQSRYTKPKSCETFHKLMMNGQNPVIVAIHNIDVAVAMRFLVMNSSLLCVCFTVFHFLFVPFVLFSGYLSASASCIHGIWWVSLRMISCHCGWEQIC